MAKKPYKPIAKQKPSTSAARRGPKVMTQQQKKIAVRLVNNVARGDIPQPPNTPEKMKGISIKTILRCTAPDNLVSGREIVIEKVQKTSTVKKLTAYKFLVFHDDPFRPQGVAARRIHEVTVIGNSAPNAKICEQPTVFCSCDCDDWKFRWEYAVALRGGTRILYSNGEHPVMTNPQLSPGCCKHIVGCFNYIMKKKL